MPKLFVTAAIAAALLANAAVAQDAATVRQACSADLQRLCAGVQPGGGRILQCIRTHKNELSPDCQSALAQVAAQMKARVGTSTATPNAQ
jgi:hypothetical protein